MHALHYLLEGNDHQEFVWPSSCREAARYMNKQHVVLHDCYGIGMKHVLGCGIRIRVFPIRFTRVTYSRAAAHRDRLGPPVCRRRGPHGVVAGPFRLRQPLRDTAGIASSGTLFGAYNDFCLLCALASLVTSFRDNYL
jgi:hypothetical protein